MIMSYIQCVGFRNQIIFTSDGRDLNNQKIIIDERYNRIRRLSDKVAVAHSGHRIYGEMVINNAISQIANVHKMDIDDFNTLILESIEEIYQKDPDIKSIFRGCLIIGGFKREKSGGIISIKLNNGFITERHDLKDKPVISFSAGSSESVVLTNLLPNNLQKMLNYRGSAICKTDIYKVMSDTSQFVARIDETVNRTIFREIIKL